MDDAGILRLSDYVQMACNGGRSATLRVASSGGWLGEVVIVQGEIWTARDPAGQGVEAVLRLLRDSPAGSVSVDSPPRPHGARTIHRPWMRLLLEAARESDEGQEPADEAGPDLPAPEVGDVVGRCLLTHRLGSSPSYEAFLALHTALREPVVVKIGRAGMWRDAPWEELERLQCLQEPAVVRLLEFSPAEPWPFLITGYVNGISLKHLVAQSGPLKCHRAARVFEAVLTGLSGVWERGALHQDLRPANILLGRGGEVWLADAGLAVVTRGTRGIVAGAAPYMAPEVAAGAPPDVQSDLYSVGASLFEVITGRVPFLEPPEQVTPAAVRETVRRARAQVPDLEPELEAVIVGLLAREPATRPTPDQVREALRGQAKHGGRATRRSLHESGEWRSLRDALIEQVRERPDAGGRPARWHEALQRLISHVSAELLFAADGPTVVAQVGRVEGLACGDLAGLLTAALDRAAQVCGGAADQAVVRLGDAWLTGLRLETGRPEVLGVVSGRPLVQRKEVATLRREFRSGLAEEEGW